jgi:GTPase Era involved in 16S rRNA processing
MSQPPVFAVVGHPNKGKSSVVATLSQNDAIAIALEPGTTRQCQRYTMKVDGQVLYTLADTPGFQRPRAVLEWLQAHSLSASDRADTVRAFLIQHRDDERYRDECELLTPIMEGAGIIYVVDGSVPYSPAHEAEMTILRWTGRPSLALINSIGADDHSDTWKAALGQFFQVVKQFNAMQAPYEEHLKLLKAFGQLEPDWEEPLETAIEHLQAQRQERKARAAELISRALEDMMGHQQQSVLPPDVAGGEQADARLRQRWYDHQRRREQQLRKDIETLYQHHRIERQEAALEWHSDHDLFSEKNRQFWGVSRKYMTGAGFGAGAVSGAGIDALTLGGSLGAGALIGGVLGAAGSYFYGDRLAAPLLKTTRLAGGTRQRVFGPPQDPQFGYIVMGRAVNHWWSISQRNHAGRSVLELPPTDAHWLDTLPAEARKAIHRALERGRKQKPLESRERQQLVSAIQQAMEHYHHWRLNQTEG